MTKKSVFGVPLVRAFVGPISFLKTLIQKGTVPREYPNHSHPNSRNTKDSSGKTMQLPIPLLHLSFLEVFVGNGIISRQPGHLNCHPVVSTEGEVQGK